MSKISNPVVSDTFSTWLTAANKSYSRLNQFAVSESALYANTITANVSLVMSGGATFKGQALDSRFANTVNLALKASQADHLAALANTNQYIASMSTDVQLANTNLAIAQLNTNLLATNTAIRLLNTNTQSALDTQEAKQASNLANTNSYIATQATAIADLQNGYNFTGAVGVTGTLTANAVTIDHGDINITGSGNRAINVNSATGGASIELGGATGAHVDFKQPYSDDLDMRIGSGATGGYISTAGGVLNIQANTTYDRLQTYSGNTQHQDNVYGSYGSSGDMKLYHDTTNSVIWNQTGELRARAAAFRITNGAENETMALFEENGAATLLYDNTTTFETTTNGVTVTGPDAAAGTLNYNQVIRNSDAYSTTPAAGILFQAKYNSGGAYADAGGISVVKENATDGEYGFGLELHTRANGASITRALKFDGAGRSIFYANTTHNDNVRAFFGTSNDGLEIYHDGSDSHIKDSGTGDLYISASDDLVLRTKAGAETAIIANDDGAVDLYYDNVSKFVTTSTGVQVKGNANAAIFSSATASGATTLDFATYAHFHLILTGNLTLSNPSTEVPGSSGLIFLKQDGSGSRTLSLGTDFEKAGGGGFTLSTAAGATDVIPYYVVSAGRILLGSIQRAMA